MKVKILSPQYIQYLESYDPYAPIGLHMGNVRPRKYIEMSLKDFLKMKMEKFFKKS